MARVVVPSPVFDKGLTPLDGHELLTAPDGGNMSAAELLEAVRDADAIVCQLHDKITEEVFAAGTNLKVVATISVGYDNIDVPAATRAGVAACNTPGVLDETTADLAFALILAACRVLGDSERDLRAGRWGGWKLDEYLGQDVHGATLGLVGYGRIGRAVARRAEGFSMQVLHHDLQDTGAPGFVADLEDLLPVSDVVSLHVPLGPKTRGLIDARRLSLMKPTAVLINTSRGPVVDEEALGAALESGQIFAAGLDVYENEPAIHPRLLSAPRAVLLPHIGSASVTTRLNMALLATGAVAEVLRGGRPPNTLNPEVFG